MSLFCVKLELMSPITSLPTSQSIFGTICHFYENEYGKNSLEKLLCSFEYNPIFLNSSLFLEYTLPIPQDFIPQIESVDIKDKNMISHMKETKKIKYISKEIFKEYAKDLNNFNNSYYSRLFSGQYIIQNHILMFSNELNIIHSKSIEVAKTRVSVDNKEYYQDKILYFDKNSNFEFYIDIFDKSYENDLVNVIKKMKYINIGGHKSIGYNLFSVFDIVNADNIRLKHPKLLLSRAIGDSSIDYQNSYYQLKEQTLKFNQSVKQVNRKRTIVFLEGSIISTTKNYIGSLIEEKNGDEITYQNVLGLLV